MSIEDTVFERLVWFMRQDSFVEDLSEVMQRAIDRLRSGQDELEASRFIVESTQDALTRHAENVGLTRDQGESDDLLRQRIQLEIEILNSRGTIPDIQSIFQNELFFPTFDNFEDHKTRIVERHDQGIDAFFRFNLDFDFFGDFFEGTFGYVRTDGTTDDDTIEGFNEGVYSGTKNELEFSLIEETIKRTRAAGVRTRIFREGEFGYTSTDPGFDDSDVEGFNSGRYSGFLGGTF